MKQMKKIVGVLMATAVAFTAVPAAQMDVNAAQKTGYVKSVKLSKKADIILTDVKPSSTKKVSVRVTTKGKGTSKKISAKSSNTKIVTVRVKSNAIVLTGKKPGKSTITVTSKANGKNGKKLSRKLSVKVKKVSLKALSFSDFEASVSGMTTGVSKDVVFTIVAKAVANDNKTYPELLDGRDVALYRDDAKVASLYDNGKNGDAKAGDGIYSCKTTLSSATEVTESYAVRCEKHASDALDIHYFDPISQSDLSNTRAETRTAQDITRQYRNDDGYIIPSKLNESISTVYDHFATDSNVLEVKKDDASVWVKFKNGIEYLYTPNLQNMDSGSGDGGNIVTFQPFKSWYKKNRQEETGTLDDDSTDGAASAIADKYPSIEFSGDYDDNSCLTNLNSLGENEIILWHGHGGYSKATHSVLCSGTDPDVLTVSDAEDLQNGKIILDDLGISITSKYIDDLPIRLDNSFVYLGACNSGSDSVLATSFLNKGAKAVIANNKSIDTDYNCKMMRDVCNGLMKTDNDRLYTLSEALKYAKSINGESDQSQNYSTGDFLNIRDLLGAKAVIFGGKPAENFSLADFVNDASLDKTYISFSKKSESEKITVKGTSLSDISWSIDGKKYIRLKKSKNGRSVTVTPVENGSGTITCKVRDKTLTCSFDVDIESDDTPDPGNVDKYAKDISYKLLYKSDLNDYVLVTNNSDQMLTVSTEIDGTLNGSGEKRTFYNEFAMMAPGQTQVCFLYNWDYDGNGDRQDMNWDISGAKTETELSSDDYRTKDLMIIPGNVEITANYPGHGDDMTFTYTNKTNKDLGKYFLCLGFAKDANGNILSVTNCMYHNDGVLKAGESEVNGDYFNVYGEDEVSDFASKIASIDVYVQGYVYEARPIDYEYDYD